MPLDIDQYAATGARLRVHFFDDNETALRRIASRIVDAFRTGSKLLAFGNGGSAADAQHVAAELVNRFRRDRQALPAIALTTDTSVITSVANDSDFNDVFARQVRALGRPGDVALAISTSGNSPNVITAIGACREIGIAVIGLSGGDGGAMAGVCDELLVVESHDVPLVQEIHLAAEHVLCDLVEEAFSAKP